MSDGTTTEKIKALFEQLVSEHPDDWDYYRAVCDEVLMWHEGRREPPGTWYRECVRLKAELAKTQSERDKFKPFYDEYYR